MGPAKSRGNSAADTPIRGDRMTASSDPKRCAWCQGVSDAYQHYHDHEWGVPARDDHTQFEFLILEGAQAGLSWSTVLNKRDGYRKAFAEFDPEKVSRFNSRKIESLIVNPAIIRNRKKIEATVNNAKRFLEVQESSGSFSAYIWSFVDGNPVQNRWRRGADVPATSDVSDALSKDMKQRGFKFVGSTILYAHMQATGMVNDHIVGCYRHDQCAALG
jgi:DNA-3-methyladenine glycosylase I